MDPVSALGLAAAVVQFASFTSKVVAVLLATSDSVSGLPSDIASLEDVCTKLCAQNERLNAAHQLAKRSIGLQMQPVGVDDDRLTFEQLLELGERREVTRSLFPTLLGSYQRLSSLLEGCNGECAGILSIVERVKTRYNPNSRRGTIAAAVRLGLKKGEVDQVEERMRRLQAVVLMEMCNISM